jgi:raffinose/stachyose/melibiose transport system substrate-binding protein
VNRFAAFAVVATLLFSACVPGGGGGGGGGGAASPGGGGAASPGGTGGQASGTVRLLVAVADDPEIEAAAKQEVQEFQQANPGVRVTREAINNDQLRAIIQTRLRSGRGPDVFGYDTGPGFGGVLAKAGLVADLTDAYKRFGWKHYDWAKTRCTYGGKVYCLPAQVEELGIFYNQDLFAKHGLQEPKTFEEFAQVADKLKAAGVTPVAFGDKDKWPAGHQFSMTLSNILGKKGIDEILYGNGRWDDPKVVRAISVFFKEFVDKGYMNQRPVALTYDDQNALFYQQKAAMVPTGTWMVPEYGKQKFKVGFFAFPAIDGGTISPAAGLGAGTFMAANTPNPEASLQLLNFYAQEETARKQLERFSTIAAFPFGTEGLKLSPLAQKVVSDMAAASKDPESFGYNIDVLTPERFNKVMFDGFQLVLNGTRTPEQQAQELQKAWEAAKAAGETLQKP